MRLIGMAHIHTNGGNIQELDLRKIQASLTNTEGKPKKAYSNLRDFQKVKEDFAKAEEKQETLSSEKKAL